ncbi:hypothetical protein BBK14_10645 [Parafrankia soli]|uniref:Uncharacterized protein n=1 Tax=Parafrankia soli TaxID=2599596 RepID=A0A1S1RCA4_9ACTN|nr:hypothetical protein BBK14_10645 [Parafrankia soli]
MQVGRRIAGPAAKVCDRAGEIAHDVGERSQQRTLQRLAVENVSALVVSLWASAWSPTSHTDRSGQVQSSVRAIAAWRAG